MMYQSEPQLPGDDDAQPPPPKNDFQATIREASSTAEHDERSPLLPSSPGSPKKDAQKRRTRRSPSSILLMVLVVVVLFSFGEMIKEAPETRIYESVICYRYYEKNDSSKISLPRDKVGPGAIDGVPEMLCKADDVQDELAMLIGYQNFFDGLPVLLLAIPFGWAADRFGRWPILFLNLVQWVMRTAWTQLVTWHWEVFDIRAIWLASGLTIMGGGSAVASSLFFVLISDITAQEDRAGAFLQIGAVNLSASLFMPPLAAWLMRNSPWTPALIGLALQCVATLLFLLIPETLDYRKDETAGEDDASPNTTTFEHESDQRTRARRWILAFKSSTSFLTDDWRVPALIAPFLCHILIAGVGRLLLQYVSKRYGLTFSEGTLLVTIRNGVVVLLLFAILPFVTKIVMRLYGWGGQQKDLYLARASQTLLALGWLFVAASPNVPTVAVALAIGGLGAGSAFLIRSFMTSLVPAHHIARAYSIISIIDTIGAMFGAPLLAQLFKHGLAIGGMGTGLPFWFLGGVSAFFAGLLFVVRLRKGEGEQTRDEEEE